MSILLTFTLILHYVLSDSVYMNAFDSLIVDELIGTDSMPFNIEQEMEQIEIETLGMNNYEEDSELNCDYAIGNFSEFVEPIGICIDLEDISYRTDYDLNSNEIIFKQFNQTACNGDFIEYFPRKFAKFVNINTGYTCHSYAYLTGITFIVFATGEVFKASPFLSHGVVGDCYGGGLFGYAVNVEECTDGVSINTRFYRDDKCENIDLIAPDEWHRLNRDGCSSFFYPSEEFGFDISLKAIIDQGFYMYIDIRSEIVCAERKRNDVSSYDCKYFDKYPARCTYRKRNKCDEQNTNQYDEYKCKQARYCCPVSTQV